MRETLSNLVESYGYVCCFRSDRVGKPRNSAPWRVRARLCGRICCLWAPFPPLASFCSGPPQQLWATTVVTGSDAAVTGSDARLDFPSLSVMETFFTSMNRKSRAPASFSNGKLRAGWRLFSFLRFYRQVYADTGIATDSARVLRSGRWVRLLGRPCRLFARRPMPHPQVPG